jgi:hypothetical protein
MIWFVHCFLKPSKIDISESSRFFSRRDLFGRIETEQKNHQNENDWRQAHGRKITKARIARRTPSNGLVSANQKETFQPDSWVIELVFTLFSQAFEDRDFTMREISSVCLEPGAGGIRAMPSSSQRTNVAHRYAAMRKINGLSVVKPTATLKTERR